MPSLKECKEMIAKLAEAKKWGSKVETKIFYAMIELGEAGDIWKHRGDKKYLDSLGIQDLKEAVAEELIDTIFYCLHALHCLDSNLDPDELFIMKYNKNKSRERVYVDDRREEK